MSKYIFKNNLFIDKVLYKFIQKDLLPKSGIKNNEFWEGFEKFISKFETMRISLVNKRKYFQSNINLWHKKNSQKNFDIKNYKAFLYDIKYLVPEKADFKINTKNIDDEISSIPGPQLVVPINNARYAINAANARWGSIYNALYGTNLIPDKKPYEISLHFNKERGQEVINKSKKILDIFAPLINETYSNIKGFKIKKQKLVFERFKGTFTSLKIPQQFKGYVGNIKNPTEIILEKNQLHIRVQFDKNREIKNIFVESAISVIMDCEDSVATVDGEDKTLAYKNWQKLLKGTLKTKIIKNNNSFIRKLNKDIKYSSPSKVKRTLKGKALMLVRNVGHLMTTPSLLDKNKNEVGEGLLDAVITSLCALEDLKEKKNSKNGSIYIVKPKMHGPEEVKFAVDTFKSVEELLKIPKNTIKIGIMDEERRTSLNLKECIREARNRVFFINTGFLDRTGDEIHTSMLAGTMVKKGEMKKQSWISSYEYRNVSIGLKCGFVGKAQIGKGMWAMPNDMNEMYNQKIQHVVAGANTAWVPSPTAATIHALHYHKIDVVENQKKLMEEDTFSIDSLLEIPVIKEPPWTLEEIINEIENNVQSILGYVVKWIDQGIGCSKVPDINNIELMEDRATLRISSQHLANWLYHGICKKDDVLNSFKKMAKKVDDQNSKDKNYIKMSTDFDNSIAFKTACLLVFDALNQPSGYTEPILHEARLNFKKITSKDKHE
ncbi:MAG: malate synthase G [Rickettsiales bacterium]|nr:malate synthase G [Rickettsiales bacterium]OUW05493.1 MAG: malate synthase G [Betaproteobacteria bacterium TMED156]